MNGNDRNDTTLKNDGGEKNAVVRNKPATGERPDAEKKTGSQAGSHSGSQPDNQADNPSGSLPGGQQFGIVRYLAWVTLVLVLILTLVITLVIGNQARETLLAKQQNFASLLAENLNNQIYRRFTLPTLIKYRRIALRQPVIYEALDKVVQSIIHGLHLRSLRIYGHGSSITYSAANRDELGREDLATPQVVEAAVGDRAVFTLDSEMPLWQAFFRFSLDENTFILRTTYPLRMENRVPSSEEAGPLMGVLEFTQDITEDVEDVIRFQWSIMGVTLISSLILFLLLIFFIRKAQLAMRARMAEEQRLVNELHQHEKLAGMGRVVASIAHEIRNPLGIIRSSAELLLRRPAGADPVTSRILQAIYDEAKRLSQTVSDFLDYARPKPLVKAQVDVTRVLAQVLAFLEPELNTRSIPVIRSGDLDEPLVINGDKDLLYRAVYNILSNAIQAIGNDGSIVLSQRITEGPHPSVELIVTDSGPGFDEENMTRFLDPFFTTKEGGTGLGLPIVNSIIKSHEGSLELANAPDGGGRVTILLPLA